MYKTYVSPITGEITVYVVESASWTNSNNKQYLAWVAEGNTAQEWTPEG